MFSADALRRRMHEVVGAETTLISIADDQDQA